MVILMRHIYVGDSLDSTETYIVSETGHFVDEDNEYGWIICLGSEDSADDYVEVDDGVQHELPVIDDVHLPAGYNNSYEIDAEEALRIITGDDGNE